MPITVLDFDSGFAKRYMRMPSGPVRDLMGWLESAGCLVVAEDFGAMTGGGRVDGLSQWVGDWPVMLVNGRAPTDRLRLTLAHELGHLCLHSAELGGDPEDEANAFASEFLMPADVDSLRAAQPQPGQAPRPQAVLGRIDAGPHRARPPTRHPLGPAAHRAATRPLVAGAGGRTSPSATNSLPSGRRW